MAQISSLDSDAPREVDIAGPVKKPERGRDANFSVPGDTSYDNAKLCSIFSSIFDWADTYRRRFLPEWLKAYQQYNAEGYDQSKAEWQSQLFVPVSTQAADITVDRVVSFLFQHEDWFDILPEKRSQDDIVDRAKKMIKWQLRKSDAEMAIATSVKDAVICGNGFMKIYFSSRLDPRTVTEFVNNEPLITPEGEEIPTGGKWEFKDQLQLEKVVRFEPLMATDIWLDPSGRGRFIIQRTRRALSDVWELARDQKDEDGNILIPKVYDPDEVAKVQTSGTDPQRDAESSIIRRDTPYLTNDQAVDVWEYWGDFIDPKNGVVLYRNIVATFVQRSVCVRRPQANPFRHGKAPYIAFQPKLLPHQVYGAGILFWSSKIQDALNRQANIIADKALLQVPTLECDAMAARHSEQLTGSHPKWTPGKIWLRRGQEKQIFHAVEGFMPPSMEDFGWYDRLINMFQQTTGVNEFASGTPTSDNRKTKSEVEIRTASTQQIFNGVAMHIEKYAMSPLLKMVYLLMVQFETQYEDDNLLRMFGDRPDEQQFIASLAGMSEEERWHLMYLDAEFRCTGIQLQLTRQQRLNNLDQFLQRIQADPTFGVLVSKRELLSKYMRLYDISPEIILQGGAAILQAQEQQMLMQMSTPPDMQGQGPPGVTGANPHNQMTAAAAGGNQPPMNENQMAQM